jgi:hypothetical protein
MPFKVKMGSLIIVATSAPDVLKIIAASTFAKNEIAVTDLDGHPIDPEKLKDDFTLAKSNAE